MEPMSIREIEKAVRGVWWNPREGAEDVSSVTTDSRNVPAGSLFIPIVGEKFDGHRFIDAALDQSGWAIKYVKDPDEALQLRAVEKNYDAIKYIKHPTPAVQLAAIRGNYEALRYIEKPTEEAKELAISENEQAIRLIPNISKEEFLHYLSRNVLVSKYMPKGISLTPDDWRNTFKAVLSRDDVPEDYVRNFITCNAVDLTPADKVLLVDDCGSKKARRITVDEKLTLK